MQPLPGRVVNKPELTVKGWAPLVYSYIELNITPRIGVHLKPKLAGKKLL